MQKMWKLIIRRAQGTAGDAESLWKVHVHHQEEHRLCRRHRGKFQLKICRWNIVLLVCGDILDTACCLPFRLLAGSLPGICFRRESKRQSEELRQSLFLQSDCSMCFSVSCFSKRMFVIICNDVKVKFAAVFSASVLGQETPFCFT